MFVDFHQLPILFENLTEEFLMSNRIIGVVEKNIVATPANPITLVGNVPTDVLPDISDKSYAGIEVAARYIFNNTGAIVYYAFGQDVSTLAYHGIIQNQQQLNASDNGQRVSVLSASGGVVVPTELRRIDLTTHVTIFPARNP